MALIKTPSSGRDKHNKNPARMQPCSCLLRQLATTSAALANVIARLATHGQRA
jgi:hypothetical protein